MIDGTRAIAVIPAAGMGRRMNAGINKQYLLLGGEPIVGRTIRILSGLDEIDEIVVVVPEAEISFCRSDVIERLGLRKVTGIVAGGSERQQSVYNALLSLDAADDDIVIIHDGVRPFVTKEMVTGVIDALRGGADGAVVAVPLKDTVKVVTGEEVVRTPDRSAMRLAQTPQGFRMRTILEAHRSAIRDGHLGTDDASLVERMGKRVVVVPGDYRNIKITTPEDLILAEAFLAEGGS